MKKYIIRDLNNNKVVEYSPNVYGDFNVSNGSVNQVKTYKKAMEEIYYCECQWQYYDVSIID